MKNLGLVKTGQYHVTLYVITLLILFACSKDNDPSREEINEKLLAGSDSKTWLIISSTVNGTESLLDCVTDDYWTFKRTQQVTRQDQTTPCTNGFPNSQSSSWNFGDDGGWLTFFGGTYEIVSITENEMKLKFPSAGKTYIDTFVKK
ncbi:MAG TPA: hypothetical protein VGD40_23475 [Chryseosolibacter sp.]